MTPDELRAATGCTEYVAGSFAPFLTEACANWGIDTPERVAAFVAQFAFETGKFTQMEESLNYTRAIALCNAWGRRFRFPRAGEESLKKFSDGKRNPFKYVRQEVELAEFVYGGRMGNGPEGSGDGWNFRGRGAGLTGRDNYQAFAEASALHVLETPGMASMPPIACEAFGWYWKTKNLNRFADARDYVGLTKGINGGLNGYEIDDDIPLSDRKELHAQSLIVFC